MLTYVRPNNKASLVNMLVTFCGKLECSFLTATISVETRRRFNVYKIFTRRRIDVL